MNLAEIDLRAGLPNADPDFIRSIEEGDRRRKEALKGRVAKRGKLGLPKAVDERRMEYLIVDEAFESSTTFDKVLIYQIPARKEMEKFADGSSIYLPQNISKWEEKGSHRGVLLDAGLQARDELSSNGIELGDVVEFIEITPYRKKVANVGGVDEYTLVMSAGVIVGSLDLAERLKSGKLKVVEHEWTENGMTHARHLLVEGKKKRAPVEPRIREDQ